MNQSKFVAIPCTLLKAGQKSSVQVAIGICFPSRWLIERVSNECCKTKTKVITLARVRPIKKDGDNPVNQSKLEVITRSRHKARENVHARATIGFGFISDCLKKWRE